jgi:hypothetical protein
LFAHWILQDKFNEKCADILGVDLEEVLTFVRAGVAAPLPGEGVAAPPADEVVAEDAMADEELSEE